MASPGFPAFPHLVLGGARSGKSTYAEGVVASLTPPYVYVATARIWDEEMRLRVQAHRQRRGVQWEVRETPLDLTGVLRDLQGKGRPVLVDCLTLWLTNVLMQDRGPEPEKLVESLCEMLRAVDYPLVLVSNEVGGGIVPENALARRFRDLSGWTNQRVAAVCPKVTCVMAGLPLSLKGAP